MPLHVAVRPTDAASIGSAAIAALESVYGGFFAPASLAVDVELVTMPAIQTANKEYRDLDQPTDVLSFPLYESLEAIRAETEDGSLLGSIIICPEKAAAYGESLPQLLHHGLLHLSGYDHETDLDGWKAAEGQLLEALRNEGLSIPGIPL